MVWRFKQDPPFPLFLKFNHSRQIFRVNTTPSLKFGPDIPALSGWQWFPGIFCFTSSIVGTQQTPLESGGAMMVVRRIIRAAAACASWWVQMGCLVVHQYELLLITRHLKLTFFAPENGLCYPKGNYIVFQASIFRCDNVSFRECILIIIRSTTVDGSEIRRSPVEVGGLSHDLPGFIHPNGGWFWFLNHQQLPTWKFTKCLGNPASPMFISILARCKVANSSWRVNPRAKKEWHVKVKLGIFLLKNVHPWKLTWHMENPPLFNRKYIFKWWGFPLTC